LNQTKLLMRIISCFFLMHLSVLVCSQEQLKSQVHHWKVPIIGQTNFGSERLLFNGAGALLSKHELKGISVKSGEKLMYNTGRRGDELFFIIKEGPVRVSLNQIAHDLDTGSVVFLLPGDEVIFENKRKDDISFYEMRMVSLAKPNMERGRKAGPSFVRDWYDMVYKPHDKGGVRQLFDRQTAMLNRFDIHITSLDPGISSHPPHTHKNEEIILIIDGVGEMQLGEGKQKISSGDAAWVASNIPHNFSNLGNRPAVYFAIQWN
jgi:(S)-ureidoglycine aminohydrolase